MASHFAAAREILRQAIADRGFPAAAIEVGNSRHPLWREAFGRLTFDPRSAPARDDTVFDLASLTKVLATTMLVMIIRNDGSPDVFSYEVPLLATPGEPPLTSLYVQ